MLLRSPQSPGEWWGITGAPGSSTLLFALFLGLDSGPQRAAAVQRPVLPHCSQIAFFQGDFHKKMTFIKACGVVTLVGEREGGVLCVEAGEENEGSLEGRKCSQTPGLSGPAWGGGSRFVMCSRRWGCPFLVLTSIPHWGSPPLPPEWWTEDAPFKQQSLGRTQPCALIAVQDRAPQDE